MCGKTGGARSRVSERLRKSGGPSPHPLILVLVLVLVQGDQQASNLA